MLCQDLSSYSGALGNHMFHANSFVYKADNTNVMYNAPTSIDATITNKLRLRICAVLTARRLLLLDTSKMSVSFGITNATHPHHALLQANSLFHLFRSELSPVHALHMIVTHVRGRTRHGVDRNILRCRGHTRMLLSRRWT